MIIERLRRDLGRIVSNALPDRIVIRLAIEGVDIDAAHLMIGVIAGMASPGPEAAAGAAFGVEPGRTVIICIAVGLSGIQLPKVSKSTVNRNAPAAAWNGTG